MVQRSPAWVQIFCLCITTTALAVTAQASSADKEALLAFKDLVSNQELLLSWTASSDPCSDSWLGVSCNCSSLLPPLSAAACVSATANREDAVVLLNLRSNSTAFGEQIIGRLAPELGNIPYLQSLRLDGHKLQVRLTMHCEAALSQSHSHAGSCTACNHASGSCCLRPRRPQAHKVK